MKALNKEDFKGVNKYLCQNGIFDSLGDVTVKNLENGLSVLTIEGAASEGDLYSGNLSWPKCDNYKLNSLLHDYVDNEAKSADMDTFAWGINELTMSAEIKLMFYINISDKNIYSVSITIDTDFGYSHGDGSNESYHPMDDETKAKLNKIVKATKFSDVEGLNTSLKYLIDKYIV